MLNRIIILISLLILIKIVFSEIDKIDINDQIQVIIQNNTYIGFKNTVLGQNVNSFLGIPYAQPPVGSLRFKKPLPTVQNYGTIDATKFRNCCPQRKQGLFGNSSPQSEDCLYLNIWNSGDDIDLTELKPVMLYIHGGGWLEGESSNGSILAVTGDVVVVTINYRLGFIGFLYTGTDDAPGNAGLWDQVLALEWVNDNIAYFGGDPKRITLFGESVGSRSTSIHILSPLTRSLFKNAIMMSGSSLSHLSHSEPEIVLNTSLVFSKLVGCNQNDEQFSPQVIECLKQLPLDELIEAQGSRLLWTQRFGFSSNYIHGDPILPETPYDMLNSGDYKKKINLLISTVEDEGTWILYRMDQNKYSRYDPINLTLEEAYEELKQLANSIDTTPPVNGEEVANLYFKNNKLAETSSYERLKTMGIALGDFFITCPTIKFAKKLFASAPDRHKIYQMYWSSKEGDYCGPWHGACHASDFEAVFGRAFERQSSEIEKQVSLRLMKVFAHFAKHDHPPPEDGQQWLSYHVEDRHNVMPYYEMSSQPKSSGNYGFDLKVGECEQLWNQYF